LRFLDKSPFRNRMRRTDSEQARIEMKSFEETKYLRRYSELKSSIGSNV
uniref:30S ribosomal protein S21 n=1 Tax=Heligmosomoides polygyrus TaxID=6339 RepID=A0A8L8K5Q5_HELPZ